MNDFALLGFLLHENDPAGAYYFTDHSQVIFCQNYSQLPRALTAIEAAQKSGKYIVGYIAYEAIYGLDKTILPSAPEPRHPLINCRVYASYQWVNHEGIEEILNTRDSASPLKPLVYDLELDTDLPTYRDKIIQLKQYLSDGDTYQVNFTRKYHYKFQGCPLDLYRALRHQQQASYNALLQFDDLHIVSLSPELFFRKSGQDITCKPMKGTMPRSSKPHTDQSLKKKLMLDAKNRTENIIVVDLMRNDLSQIAEPGSVSVSKLFSVETYETVHQMTSEICAKIAVGTPFGKILRALFPCGSITGAPKKRTMQIIRELEQCDRSVYTGVIGMITPENNMCFNVAIRTLVLQNQQGFLGVGGGIVYDSDIEDEFEEMQLKAKFMTQMPVTFALFETMYYHSKIGFPYLEKHLARLKSSAQSLGFYYDVKVVRMQLQQYITYLELDQDYRVSLLLHKDGCVDITSQAIALPLETVNICLHRNSVIDCNNILFNHKTNDASVRGVYQNYFDKLAKKHNCFDVLLCNQYGLVVEGTKTNVFIEHNGTIKTPSINSGALPGIMRQHFLENHPSTIIANITPEMVKNAKNIWVTNAVIGIKSAKLVLPPKINGVLK